jgi:peptide/nickel transport system substrate-binding protein
MTRPETRDAERLMRDVAKQRVSRRGLMKGAAAVGLALPAAASLQPQAYGLVVTAQDAPLGSSLIGELEGPIVLVDAPRPENLKQAPMLDPLVEDGTLPPVEERVPLEPLVVQPVEGIGTYGGTLRRGFTGPGDDENGNRYVSGDKLVFWDYTGT